MTENQFEKFVELRKEFKEKINYWNEKYNEILKEKIEHIEGYEITNSFIYNKKLDDITKEINVKYIWIQDNPGYNEMLQSRYAVGASGKAGQNFLEKSGLVNDFDKEVIVLNKEPVHTKVTANLSKLKNNDIQKESQIYMADLIYKFHEIFECDLWILGLSNLNGIFKFFKENIEILYNESSLHDKLYLYYHFSQGQFKKAYNSKEKELNINNTQEILNNIGIENRKKYFDF